MDRAQRLQYWGAKQDGSLRNAGAEFVTRGGLGGATLEAAIKEIATYLDSIQFHASWRCSTHMHVNMLDFTVDQIVKYVLAYMCVEPILFDFCEQYRRSSNFCVQLTKSASITKNTLTTINTWGPFGRIDGVKYMALNMLPIGNPELGTLEFRGSHALTTEAELFALANKLLSIKKFVAEFDGDSEKMLQLIQDESWRVVLRDTVPEGYMPDKYTEEFALMCAWSCQKHYSDIEKKVKERKKSRPDVAFVDEMSTAVHGPSAGATLNAWYNSMAAASARASDTATSTQARTFRSVSDQLHPIMDSIVEEIELPTDTARTSHNYYSTKVRLVDALSARAVLEYEDHLQQITDVGPRGLAKAISGAALMAIPNDEVGPNNYRDIFWFAADEVVKIVATVLATNSLSCYTSVARHPAIASFRNVSNRFERIISGAGAVNGDSDDYTPSFYPMTRIPELTDVCRLLEINDTPSFTSLYRRLTSINIRLKNRENFQRRYNFELAPVMTALQAWKMFQLVGAEHTNYVMRDFLRHYKAVAIFFSSMFYRCNRIIDIRPGLDMKTECVRHIKITGVGRMTYLEWRNALRTGRENGTTTQVRGPEETVEFF